VDFNEKNYCDFLFHLCAPLFKLRTPPLFYFCLDSHVIFPHLGSSCALREQFWGLPVLWFSCRTSLCLGPHCSQDRFGFVFLPLSTVRDLSSSRSCFDFFVHTWIHRLQASLSLLFDFLFFSRACRALPGLVPSLICSFVPGLCAAFLGAIFFLASRERRAKFSSGLHAARVHRFSGRSRLFHFDFLCICVTQFCGNY
jgi:hypothetical protein